MKLRAGKGCKGGVATKVGRMIGYEYSVAAEMFTLLAIKFLIKLKCCQTLHSDSVVRSATSSCSIAGGRAGEGAVVGVTGCLCGLRSRSGIRSHMWCETCVAFVVAGIPPFWVSYAFIPGLIHSYIHSVTFISFHCVPHRPPPPSPTCCITKKPQCTRPHWLRSLSRRVASSRFESFGHLFRVLHSSFRQVFSLPLLLLPFVVN